MKKEILLESLKKSSLRKYSKMIAFARKMPPNSKPNEETMIRRIEVGWHGSDCPYCEVFLSMIRGCQGCPLRGSSLSQRLFGERCCDGLWNKMDKSVTWKEWIVFALLIRRFIEDPELFRKNWKKNTKRIPGGIDAG